MKWVDDLLNRLTMYRLVVYALSLLVIAGLVAAQIGRVAFKPTNMIISLALILIVAYLVDRGLGRLFKVPNNTESWLITGLILFLIVPPPSSVASGLAVGLAAAISSASKFLISRRGKHIFNPAALAAAFLSLWGFWPTTWWIGSSFFWPLTLVLGLAVVRKIRRFPLYLTFMIVSLTVQAFMFAHAQMPVADALKRAALASPLFFLGGIMLTEPATMPSRRGWQILFAAGVGLLYITGWRVGPLIIYPEVALLLGNIGAYIVSPKFRVRLQLLEIQKVSDWVYNYIFTPDLDFNFLPGQYMEWTLAGVPYDSRGNRRTFTIASSPTEDDVMLGLKYHEPSSTYKATLKELRPGDIIYGNQLAGNFTLTGNESKKLAFIAGGIGITPFRSMIKYLVDTNQSCDIVIVYLVSDPQELAYVEDFKAASKIGVKTLPVVTNPSKTVGNMASAKLSAELLAKAVPDYAERLFYISGSNNMVEAAKSYLKDLGVATRHIKTDHFSGY